MTRYQSRIKDSEEQLAKELVERIALIADNYHIPHPYFFSSPSQKASVLRVRNAIVYILRIDYSIPYRIIGQIFGGTTHSSLIKGFKKFEFFLEHEEVSREIYNYCYKIICEDK
jgi:chromosomal replication initiation ATPase DnaA